MKSDVSDGEISDEDMEYEHDNATGSEPNTGNEADIEDNLMPSSNLTRDMLWNKLRTKPSICTPTTPCGLAQARKQFGKNHSGNKASSVQRLSARPVSGLETITNTIERPAGSVPPLALPNWHCLALNTKIPGVPAPNGLLYYSPGKLCTKLYREPKVYSVADPYNRERVIGTSYTALHDPHAKDFLKRPQTRRMLCSQGLINKDDETMYTLREFNKYRDYLRTLYNDVVHQDVHYADELWKSERAQIKSIQQFLSQREGKEAEREKRITRSRRITKEHLDYKISRLLHKQQQTQRRLIAWAREKEQQDTNRIVRGYERKRLRKERLQSLHQARKEVSREVCRTSVMKDIRAYERRNSDIAKTKQAHESFLREWMDSKINQSRQRMEEDVRIKLSSRETLQQRAARRQRRVEMYRENLPAIIQKRKLSEMHRWDLARKYFYIWLGITRKRKATPSKDETHCSVWIRGMSNTLEETLKYLRFHTNHYEKLDDFILNIVRLKNEIAKQLAIEEAEEEDAIEKEAQELEVAEPEKEGTMREVSKV